jgi:hypothetical protein
LNRAIIKTFSAANSADVGPTASGPALGTGRNSPCTEPETQYIEKKTFIRDLGRIVGHDLSKASTQVLQEALNAISYQNPLPMAVEERYHVGSCLCVSKIQDWLGLRSSVFPPRRWVREVDIIGIGHKVGLFSSISVCDFLAAIDSAASGKKAVGGHLFFELN